MNNLHAYWYLLYKLQRVKHYLDVISLYMNVITW
jgi:hypothetical protein